MRKKTRKKTPISPERLMQFGFAYAPPLIIGAAVNCKVFDTLEGGPKTLEQVGHTTGASERGLRAIMNALVGLNLLKKDRRGQYSLTPESEAFLVSNKPGTLAGFFAMAGTHLLPDWLHLSEAVRTGVPPVAVNQEATGPKFFSVLVENIIPMSYPAAAALGRALKLGKTRRRVRVLDIAAGSGIWGIALAQQSPLVRVTAQDWAEMIPTTKRITQKFGVADRFSYVEGDVLKADVGNDYDIATLGHILHTEGEVRSGKLLAKVFRALKSGGTIAIGEWLVNDRRTRPVPSLIFAVNMLVHSERGDAFSFNEIQLQRNQELVPRSGLQESAKASGAGAFTANSDNKSLIKNQLLIREAKCFHLIPMRKAKSRAERHASYQKPALRSEAFARALNEAKLCVAGSGGLRSLFEQAARKAASLPKQPFKENWAYLQTMLRLVRAYERGEYQQISNDALTWIVAGLNYLVDPFDLIPDKTPFLGFVDDATVVEFVADKARQALDDFMTWETAPPSG